MSEAAIGPPGAPAGGAALAALKDDGPVKGPPGCCLFVYHIPVTWCDADLNQCFAPLAPPGKLLSATVFKEKNTGVSKGFGFVNYDNATSANNAIAAMHGMQIEGKRLRVEIKKPKGAGGTSGASGAAAAIAAQQSQMQMQALAMQQAMSMQWGMNPQGAQPTFDPYTQQYTQMNPMQDPSMAALGMGGMGAGMGMGAMGMQSYGMATPGLGALGATQMAGQTKKTGPPNACLFIYHIPITWTDNDLAQCFAPFAPPGNILNAMVYKDRNTGASKGFGFVDYDNGISAQSAIAAMNGMSVDSGKRLRVEIKKPRAGQPY